MYCELYRCKGRVINGRIYMYIGSHLISENHINFGDKSHNFKQRGRKAFVEFLFSWS